ncbi:SDR family NAD(P)-dependent oxidoreductase [Phenylobacterium sp. LjRoot225]|uniref:SDR family oxidoreductase n=1 Tax=Phenylobacterium sp. LjRoot225 TaxID=3342285 RepID=UPI003ED0DDEA
MSKVIVITGAGGGLGRALARRFGGEGETVVLLGRTLTKVEAVAAEIGDSALAIGCDVASPDSVRAAFAQIAECFPAIDVLINNAAVYEPFLMEEATDDQILSSIGTNLTGAMLCARSAIPMMGAGAHIINVSSESVDLPFPHMIVYQATKAGLERFSMGLYRELDPRGVRVSFVRAGQMMDEDKRWDIDPGVAARFLAASAAAGLNPRERATSHVSSVTQVFRSLIDLPADLHAASVSLFGRAAS